MVDFLLDLGSTNVKWALADDSNVLERGSVPFPAPCVDDGTRFEVETDKISSLVETLLRGRNPDRLFLAVQMHGYVLLDENDKPLTNYISWKDHRGERFLNGFEELSGYGVHKKRNLPRLSIEALPEEILKKAKRFETLGSYLVHHLTGRSLTHVSDAAPTGFLDIRTLSNRCPFIFPKVTREVECVGVYRNIEVYTPIGDTQAAFLGSEVPEGTALLNLGTACQIMEECGQHEEGPYECRPYFQGRFLKVMTGLSPIGTKPVQELLPEYQKAFEAMGDIKDVLVAGGRGIQYKDDVLALTKALSIDCRFRDGNEAIEGLLAIRRNAMKHRIGTMISEVPFPNLPLIMKSAGLDFFLLDYEHGGFDYKDMLAIITVARLAGIQCIVRVPGPCRKDITKIMDMGADGILLPMTNGPEEIEKAVRYAKYRPIGERGVSTMRAHTMYDPKPTVVYQKEANERTLVFAQIETKKGVENAEAILQVPGVDGFMIGPNDLSDDLGILGEKSPKAILDIIERLSKLPGLKGLITNNKDYLARAKELGYDYLSIGSELNALKDGFHKIKEEHK